MSATATLEAPRSKATETYAPPESKPVFKPDDLATFQGEDRKMGIAIICTMTAIFAIGLIMYTVIAYLATQSHMY